MRARDATDALNAGVRSAGPRELGREPRRPGLHGVVHAEGADPGALRPGQVHLGTGRVEDVDEPGRFPALAAERDDVLDLDLDRVTNLQTVVAVLAGELDLSAFGAQVLSQQGTEGLHRPA